MYNLATLSLYSCFECMDCNYEEQLISTKVALDFLLDQAELQQTTEKVGLSKGLGRVLQEDVIADIDVPNFDNSAMDGYAINLANHQKPPYSFKLVGKVAAGSVGNILEENCAVRIFTGAKIPQNTNAIAIQERCEESDNIVEVFGVLTKGEYIRSKGDDIKQNSIVLKKGRKLTAADIGLCASIGIDKLTVYAKLKIGVFFSGNELVSPPNTLYDGQIYNANQFTINGLLQDLNCEVIDIGNIKDDFTATCQALKALSNKCDVIITTGGVSVGEEDHIKPALEKLGTLKMWKIKMRPGKPLVYGKIANTHFMGLPGNPVSAMVTFMIFVKPLLKKISGDLRYDNQAIKAQVAMNLSRPQFRRHFARARLDNSTIPPTAKLYENQSSGVLSSMSWADGLLEIPDEVIVKDGDTLNFYPI